MKLYKNNNKGNVACIKIRNCLWAWFRLWRACLACAKPRVQFPAPHTLGMRAHICNFSIQEVEAGRSAVQGHPQLHSKSEVSPECMKPVSKKKMKKDMCMQGIIYKLFYVPGLWNPMWSCCCCCFVCLFCWARFSLCILGWGRGYINHISLETYLPLLPGWSLYM